MYVVDSLAPILLLVLLGALLRAFGFLKQPFFREINPLIYWVALPCLLFVKTAGAEIDLGPAMKISLVLSLAMGVCLGVSYPVGRLAGVTRGAMGAFLQGTSRGNLIYVGLPVILFGLVGERCPEWKEVESLAILAMSPLILVYNTTAVFVLLAFRESKGEDSRKVWKGLGIKLGTNPLVLACAAGVAFSVLGLSLPTSADRTLTLIARIALPLALVSTGAALSFSKVRCCFFRAFAASVIKVGIAPLAGWLIALPMGLPAMSLKVALIFLACPTAVVSFVMAEQLDGDHELAGSIVVVSTVLSMVALAVVLVATRGLS